MPNFDLTYWIRVAAEDDRRRILESGSKPRSGRPYLAPYFAKRDEQLRWLRESLERDLAPKWLVKLVIERWIYIPERIWED